MSFKSKLSDIPLEYRTLEDDVVDNFYVPALSEAVLYKRAVGFFSSSALLQISQGLGSIASRGGKIKLLISPKLDADDYEAIKNGYEIRKLISEKMDAAFDESICFDQKIERFTLLSYLIAKDILDIKVAVVEDAKSESTMYHEKLGIMTDEKGDMLAFSGSANETAQAFNFNYECIDVFCSWKTDESFERCQIKDLRFDKMWNDCEKSLIVMSFPEIIKNKILKYNEYRKYNFEMLDVDLKKIHLDRKYKSKVPYPSDIKFLEYQTQAIDTWANKGYKGIFDMATGTGKTITGLGALCKLYNNRKRLVVVICVPYVHLVDQWTEEAKKFNIKPIKCYSGVNYKNKLASELQMFKSKIIDFVCIITTNGTFKTDYLQEKAKLNLNDTLLIVDEAHNFGAMQISECLKTNYPFRLALSATLDRYADEYGTKLLYNFFGDKCIEYTLERAIREDKLTKYLYHPVVVSLTDDEYNRYQELTEKIKSYYISDDFSNVPESLKKLLIKRARIVAGAENKIEALKNTIAKYKNENNMLVYCGAVKYYDSQGIDGEDKKQIDLVHRMLNKELGIVSTRFTSEEDANTRKEIIESFKNKEIQALVAIKCLDEGVNVPAIKTAFILASSANPKEYIQRRGRVLRKYPGKHYAEVYDFITLPRPLDEVFYASECEKNVDRTLIKKELLRMIDFARLSNNPSECNELIDEIKNNYNLDIIDIEEGYKNE